MLIRTNIEKLLSYNPEERLTAKQAMKHPYFRDLYEQDKRIQKAMNAGPSQVLRGTFQYYIHIFYFKLVF